ncbi:Hypothetical predicted protein [Xyrichtys novacula]|uniref:Uncharacterized protein n=1 Tax=Xyrichtys novacula TaxID=13765 RepID=A0AAV1FU26_XYRNO|nr:Hypothetical predicted protein [Xyrichtys novacula]
MKKVLLYTPGEGFWLVEGQQLQSDSWEDGAQGGPSEDYREKGERQPDTREDHHPQDDPLEDEIKVSGGGGRGEWWSGGGQKKKEAPQA